LRNDRVDVFALGLRLISVALLSADGWVHLHLWQDGYRHISTIGPLFLTGAVSALVIAAVLLVRPSRLIATSGFGLVMGILAGFLVSVNFGLFGFKEALSAPYAGESIALEIAAGAALGTWTVVDLIKDRSGRATK
jgi:hypothetical protein